MMTLESAGLCSEDRLAGPEAFGILWGWWAVPVTLLKVGAKGTVMSPHPKVEPRPPPVPSTRPQPCDPQRLWLEVGETLLPHSLSAWTTFVDDGAMGGGGTSPSSAGVTLTSFPVQTGNSRGAIMQELGSFRVTSGTLDAGVYA